MQLELPKAKPPKKFLYHNNCRNGKMFDMEYAEVNQDKLTKEGWVNRPTELEKIEVKAESVSTKEIESMSPNQIVKKVKAMGYHVFNDIELAAKNAQTELSDDDLIKMLQSRNITYKPSKEELQEFALEYGLVVTEETLINRFVQSPKSLTKEELVVLGADWGLKLKMTMKEATMISHIAQAFEDKKKASGE